MPATATSTTAPATSQLLRMPRIVRSCGSGLGGDHARDRVLRLVRLPVAQLAAVHQDREGVAGAAQRRRVAGQRRDAVERAGLRDAVAARAVDERAVDARDRERLAQRGPERRVLRDLRRAARRPRSRSAGWRPRGPSRRRGAGVCTSAPIIFCSTRARDGEARGGAADAVAERADGLDHHLRDEVVAVRVHEAQDLPERLRVVRAELVARRTARGRSRPCRRP